MGRYYKVIDNPEEHYAYVMYNLLFSGDRDMFTAQDVVSWLGEYGIRMDADEVRRELSTFVRSGLLHAYVSGYEVVSPHVLGASAWRNCMGKATA